ncbi:hypothetical protein PAXRUDRAFT_8466 [Paxillus rubicundulus Ve08.2h10]|uniref:DH domain-containing protein n=1 Tax=Paxillus rubicundulus Ve08.2h10 TaxID=930991 RepID=A0A0D0EA66_9AGAM|nr:hypothetical protein PAXRUDRAFT_8466 [Paxillus rubicundulus Ve08.2h10]
MAHQSPFRLSAPTDSPASFPSSSDCILSFSENRPIPCSVATRPNWRSRSSRAFSPLTPIIASPLSTPAPSVSPHAVSLNSGVAEDKTNHPMTQQPGTTRSGRPTDPDPKIASSFNIPTPTWTSTPPTPPPNFIYRSKTGTPHPMSPHVTTSTSLPDATVAEGSAISSPIARRRRASLPLIALSKPLPPIPLSSPQTHQSPAPPALKLAATQPSRDPVRSPRTERYIPQPRLEKFSPRPISQGKAVFHLVPDNSDREDDGRGEHTLVRSDSSEPDSAVIAVIPELPLLDKKPPNRVRENSRRFHALSELLSTEVGYLLDLRTLVSVYLRLLPILTNRPVSTLHGSSSNLSLTHLSRPSSTYAIHPLTTSLRTQSYPHLSGSTQLTSAPSPTESHGPCAISVYPGRDRDKYAIRHLFSASDLDTITRNAEEILEFHERLVRELRTVVSPFGFSMSLGGKPDVNHAQSHAVQRAINAVSAVLIDHASGFDQYQSFCSGHSEAFDLVRRVQQGYPGEWDAFERRCAVVAAEMQLDASLRFSQGEASEELTDPSGSQILAFDPRKKRRHSLSSLDASARPKILPHPLSTVSPATPILSASESGHSAKDTRSGRPRLMFMDYLIKPVQRICRYPLLLGQLQETTNVSRSASGTSHESSSTSSDSSRDTVKAALQTMRTVASSVDEARRRQDLSSKSVQIVSRIAQGLLTSAASHSRPSQPSLSSTFLSSLGPCHFSGSLDVIHCDASNMARLGTVRAKYLGAFLFPGGFLVLVKVAKPKAYEPKHWFSLKGFDLVDSNTDDALLPSWFRLSSKGHTFEFAASCRREKDIWVDAIRSSSTEESRWSGQLPTSLQANFRSESIAPLEEIPFEMLSPLPTIQSIPELDVDLDFILPSIGETTSMSTPSMTQPSSRTSHRVEHLGNTTPHTVGPSRRYSGASSWIHQVPESSTFHLVRSTASAREQVDRGLLDVFSEKCLTARLHAHAHEENLFEAQKVSRSFSRSSSGLTMASAMSVAAKNRLTKRESVLVPRRKSFADGSGMLSDPESYCPTSHPVLPMPIAKRRHPKKLKIVAMAKAVSYDGDEDGNDLYIDSPSPMSHCSSSASATTPMTPLTAPLSAPPVVSSINGRSEFLAVRQEESIPKRSRSMVENVRGFFTPRSTSPTTALTREPSARSSVSSSSLLRWWSRESLRRRVRSAPDVPDKELPSAHTTQSLNVTEAPRLSLATAERPYSQPDLQRLYPQIAGPSTTECEVDYPTPPSIKGSRGPRRRWTASMLSPVPRDEDPTTRSSRLRRNLSFLHRFTPMSAAPNSGSQG